MRRVAMSLALKRGFGAESGALSIVRPPMPRGWASELSERQRFPSRYTNEPIELTFRWQYPRLRLGDVTSSCEVVQVERALTGQRANRICWSVKLESVVADEVYIK